MIQINFKQISPFKIVYGVILGVELIYSIILFKNFDAIHDLGVSPYLVYAFAFLLFVFLDLLIYILQISYKEVQELNEYFKNINEIEEDEEPKKNELFNKPLTTFNELKDQDSEENLKEDTNLKQRNIHEVNDDEYYSAVKGLMDLIDEVCNKDEKLVKENEKFN